MKKSKMWIYQGLSIRKKNTRIVTQGKFILKQNPTTSINLNKN